MPSTDDFRKEVTAQIDRAERQGRPHVELNAGEIHRTVSPGQPTDRLPMCCNALRDHMSDNDEIVFAPPAGDGASLTIRYKLPR